MRILFLSRWMPYPPDNGAKLRVFNVVQTLARRHEVTLIAFGDVAAPQPTFPVPGRAVRAFAAMPSGTCEIQTQGASRSIVPGGVAPEGVPIRARVVPYRGFRPRSTRSVAGLFSTQPRSLVDTSSVAMSEAVADECRRHAFDLIVASQLDMMPYAMAQPGTPLLLEELELTVFTDAIRQSLPRRMRPLLTWLKLSAYLRRALPRFAACTVVSEQERAHVRAAAPGYGNVRVVPNAIDAGYYDGDFGTARPNTLVFAGSLTYGANLDAARYLLGDILPLVIQKAPEVALRITGSHTGVALTSLPPARRVEYTGRVADIRPVMAQSWASVVPLRLGGGTRLKILESMALGTPVVSTSKGAEGLAVTDGEDILIADDAPAFAERVVELLRSPNLRRRLADGGRRLVASRYTWETVGRELEALVVEVAARRAA